MQAVANRKSKKTLVEPGQS